MSKEFIGAFTFRNEGDGCLTSKYLEHTEDTSYTESCKRTPNSEITDDPFEGTYRTSWLESNNGDDTAQLTITKQGSIYHIEWTNLTRNTTLQYRGRAMRYEGNLVGAYWNP
ncbi:hypothetical protein CLV51_104141 [Chitinophaga niastensis]|uniref:Lipocalin-like protein n=1 Tax=Chitinophaga niastensis TaxID=536980 RepID=A0A2P8HGV2_CHINA|nr:hypothetical protein [Chitinophaga niastensis]PSL45439.1 hypothetical protein CLV51_104141 [Chitinophaga niastensis]